MPIFLAEKERFELSRRVNPTYTLSRGASSANLSTSPCTLRATFAELAFVIIHYLLRFVNRFWLFILFIFSYFYFSPVFWRIVGIYDGFCVKQQKTTLFSVQKQRKSKKVCGFLLTKVWFYSIIQNRERGFLSRLRKNTVKDVIFCLNITALKAPKVKE